MILGLRGLLSRACTESWLADCTIHDLVPLYLVPKTPTLSARRDQQENLFFIVIAFDVVCNENVEFAFTDGNAASQDTHIFRSLYKLKSIPWDTLKSDCWTDFEDGKRKRNAEFLIYPTIKPAGRIGACGNVG